MSTSDTDVPDDDAFPPPSAERAGEIVIDELGVIYECAHVPDLGWCWRTF